MKSLERRFNNITKENPYWSSYICFAETIKEQSFNKQAMHLWFNKLVDKNDYSKKDKKAILIQLSALTKCAEDNKKQG